MKPGLFSILFLLVAPILFTSCRKHKMEVMEQMEKNINYPAAYVVNGESNNISVIRLSDNTVSETIELMGGETNNMMLWPHHVYHTVNSSTHLLAIAMPGMDLSAGHTGSVAGMKGRVMIFNAVTGTMVKELELPDMNHNAVFSPGGDEIWTSQMREGKVLVLDANTYAVKSSISVGHEPAEVTFSADGSKAYVANGGDDNVSIIDPVTKAVITTIAVGDNPVAAWQGFDGNMYVDNEDGQTVSVISVANNRVIETITLGFMPGSVAHNAIKKELWVTDPHNGKVHFWTWNVSLMKWMPGGSFNAGDGSHAVAFTNDGKVAYVTNQLAQTVSIIDVTTHVKLKDVRVGKKPNGIVIKY